MTTIPTHPELLLAQTGWLRALTAHLVSDEHAADDLTQDTLLAALQTAPPERAPLRAWLAGIARNLSANHRRRAARRREHECAAALASPEVVAPSTAETAERFAVHRSVVEAVNVLEEPYRETVLLRYWEGLPPREIARRRGVPVETVRTQVKRGIAKLRARLDTSAGGRAAWAVPLVEWARSPAARAEAAATVGTATLLAGWALPAVGAALVIGSLVVLLQGGGASPAVESNRTMASGRAAAADPEPDALPATAHVERRPVTAPSAAVSAPQDPQHALTAVWLFAAPDEPGGAAGGMFGGRGSGRRRLAATPGAAYATAITAGLDWLARHQAPEGSWSADRFWQLDESGRPGDAASETGRDVGATAIALLAFLGDGTTCRGGPYRDAVREGVLWLCRQQNAETGAFADPRSAPRHALDHALATWALTEAYGLSALPRLEPFAERAFAHLDTLRVESGGLTCPMPDETVDVAVVTTVAQLARVAARFFKLRDADDSADAVAAAWVAGRPATESGTPVATLPWNAATTAAAEAQLVLAAFLPPHELPQELVASVVERAGAADAGSRPMATHLAALGLYQVGGVPWQHAVERLDALVGEQREDGRFAGSWDPRGPWTERTGGRVFATALATLTLETFYRFSRLRR